MKWGAVIAAAGIGKRMKAKKNKQFLDLQGSPLVVHTIRAFQECPFISKIKLVVHRDELTYCRREILSQYNCEDVEPVVGGASRQQSVFNGLKAFQASPDYVLIHDGARPLISEEILARVQSALQNFEAVTTGVRVKDTIKVRTEDFFVERTLDRKQLVAIQTPQGFNYSLIRQAHKKAAVKGNHSYSDDASLVEAMGQRVKVVEGAYENIKVTTPADLDFARMLVSSQESN